uniref:Neurotransmitter-gated ion-channel ligand-binding domain-containing protein n=1 Tax=Parascaris equorum TaxID=6256 RepID=A0A914S2D9_PAREQ
MFRVQNDFRLSLVLSCPMSLEYYPLDRQTCLIDLASYAYTTDDIKYEWKVTNPIQQKEGLRQSLPSFELQDVLTDYCTSKTNTAIYTFVYARHRFVGQFLARQGLSSSSSVTTLLTMTTQSSGINAKLPPVSYTKAIDVWIGVCLAFIFGALLEFALLSKQHSQHADYVSSGYQPLAANPTRPSCCFRLFVRRYKERSKRIDVVSRLVNILDTILLLAIPIRFPVRPPCCMISLTFFCVLQVFPIGYACFNGTFLRRRSIIRCFAHLRVILGRLLDVIGMQHVNTAVPVSSYCFVANIGELFMTFPSFVFPHSLPPVSYIKAVDVWIGVCLAFIFGALLEYALVNYHGRQEFLKKEKKKKTGLQECLCPSDQPLTQ